MAVENFVMRNYLDFLFARCLRFIKSKDSIEVGSLAGVGR
jgi:hypothetical protein